MDIAARFTVFSVLALSFLPEIGIVFVLLRLLGVRRYGDTTFGNLAFTAGAILLGEFYVGWRIYSYLDDDRSMWLATIPAAVVAGFLFFRTYSLPWWRALLGAVVIYGLHVWTLPLIPMERQETSNVIIAKSEATQALPSYAPAALPNDAMQWLCDLKSWDETKMAWGPFLVQLDEPMADVGAHVKVEELNASLLLVKNPRVEITMTGVSSEKERTPAFRQFLTLLKTLDLPDSRLEEATLDRFGPDLRSGSADNTYAFALRGFRYVPRPQNHDDVAGFNRDALKQGIAQYDSRMRVEKQGRRPGAWAEKRTSDLIGVSGVHVMLVKAEKQTGVVIESGGQSLRCQPVRVHMESAYADITKLAQQFEAGPAMCHIIGLSLQRFSFEGDKYSCDLHVAWPIWANRELEIRVASLQGKPPPPPEPWFDPDTPEGAGEYMQAPDQTSDAPASSP